MPVSSSPCAKIASRVRRSGKINSLNGRTRQLICGEAWESAENDTHDRCVDLFRRHDETGASKSFDVMLKMVASGRGSEATQR